ncbi:hypothetical protein HNP21_006437 [Bacillus aryabhattai]|uniref:Uncharacterized protein n=1 Tax=Priestia aryabhattai TaxID=412384 RepID=A0A7W3NHT2_PRIAR|nr:MULTISPECIES: hypothetical protein [Priestia]MBA9043241.1 hypothetical protein [Priestia aryabhattai]MEB4889024.1 hypothetical protein [Priestia megaterium]
MAKNMEEVFQKLAASTEQVDKKTEENLVGKAKEIINSSDVKIHLSGEKVDYDSATVLKYTDNANFGVAIPYKSKESNENLSALTLIFDENKDLERYQELVVQDEDSDVISYKYFINSEEVKSGTLDTNEEQVSTQSWTGCMNTCLANQGLSNWAIGLFAALCAAACGTVILCAACIEGPLLVYGTQIMNCLDDCGPNK